MTTGTNMAVFILFFGISLLEAFRNNNYMLAMFWVMMALIFLFAGSMKKKNRHNDLKEK